jgi:hypothetical protein
MVHRILLPRRDPLGIAPSGEANRDPSRPSILFALQNVSDLLGVRKHPGRTGGLLASADSREESKFILA